MRGARAAGHPAKTPCFRELRWSWNSGVWAFKGEANRVLSLVTYLNKGWEPDHGGELVIADEHNDEIRVSPGFGTLVLFLSKAFLHEVLPATRERYSVAGWYRLNTSTLKDIDPPR